MPLARRVLVTLAALVGLVVAALGVWLAFVLGPGGTASFTARTTGPVVIGPDVLGGLDVPVTVSAHDGDGHDAATGVFLGVARAADVADVVGGARVLRAVEARFPARVLDVAPAGTGSLADPTGLDVWRTSSRGSVDVREAGSTAVLVAPTGTSPVTVVVVRHHAPWYTEALVAVVAGLLVAGAATWWLVRELGHGVPLGPLGGGRATGATRAPRATQAPSARAVPVPSTPGATTTTPDPPGEGDRPPEAQP